MTTFHALRASALTSFALALPVATSSNAWAQQAETVVPIVEGPMTELHFGERTSGATIDPGTDVDLFSFEGRQGDTVRIAIRSNSNWWDPKMEILVPGMAPINGPGCSGQCCGGCTGTLDLTLPVSGTYTLIVTDNGLDEGGGYDLALDRIPTLAPAVAQCNAPTGDSIQHPIDTDFYEFYASQGDWIRINVQSTSNWWDPRFRVFDPTGAPLHDQSCTGQCCGSCSFMIENTSLPLDGIYTIMVTDVAFDEGGGYQFTLQFIVGGCSDALDFLPYCFGDGSGTACPCGNNGAAGRGCSNSIGTGARLTGSGTPSIAADTVQLQATGLPPSTLTLYYQGTGPRNAGLGIRFGDGLQCVAGPVVRIGVRRILGSGVFGHGVAGDPAVSVAGNVPAAGATRYYQLWYRNVASYCTSSTFNLSSGLRIAWRP
jgi:hypothetical protein